MAWITQFWRDRRGVSAVEFALIAPILSTVLVLGWDGWLMASQSTAMRDAVSAGARYYQIGGSDDTIAQSSALAAWSQKPASGALGVTRACKCGAAVIACTSMCASGSPPATYVTLTATSSFSGMLQSRALTETEVVRVR